MDVRRDRSIDPTAVKPAFVAPPQRQPLRCEPVADAPRPEFQPSVLPYCNCAMHGARGGFATYRANPTFAGTEAALAVSVPAKEIRERLEPRLPALVTAYKDIHQNPELGRTEKRTAAILANRLRTLGYQVTEGVGRYADGLQAHGVVAVLENGPGPTLYLREDMDALPVVEETGLPYASQVKGVMHACGHDVHTTLLMGAAEMMMELKDRWSGRLVLVGQPSEELGAGARAMLGDGLYERFGKPDFVLGMHVTGEMAAGMVGTRPGYVMANVDSVNVTMRGRGGHGSRPEEGIDPIVMGSAFVMEAQTLVSRRIKTGKQAVVTVGAFNAGAVSNVIPNDAHLKLTIRSFEPDVRKALLSGVARIANGVAAGQGVPPELAPVIDHQKENSVDATYNNPELAERILALWKREIGEVFVSEQRMGGEDFAYYSGPKHEVPAVYLHLGATDPKVIEEAKRTGKQVPTTHQSTFAPLPEPTLRGGITAMVTAATALLAKSG
ncbi:MAG: M20 family metallopeptidase [Myxococcota bacterium]|nr:amidohydrolase [Myxococcota bacterium]